MEETYCLNCLNCRLLTSLGLFVLTVRGSEVCRRMQLISIYTEGLLPYYRKLTLHEINANR